MLFLYLSLIVSVTPVMVFYICPVVNSFMNTVNFIEADTVAEANAVDLGRYTFLDRLSATRNKYCFKIKVK
jgi:hypothetical protein